MNRKILIILFLLLSSNAYAQTGTTAPMFGLDQCLWLEDSDASVVNNYCARMIVEDGTLTDNANGSFTYSPAGAGYTIFDTSQELADILTDETGSGTGGAFGMKAVFSIDPVIENSDPDLGPSIVGKVQRSAGQIGGLLVVDDDCGHDQGKYWYDDGESRFEFCDAGSGLPIKFEDFVNVVSSTDNAVTRFDGTAGEIQNSGAILDDNNDITGDGNMTLIGGTAANSTLNLKSNSAGSGNTAANKAISFLVGDTPTEAMTIQQDGRIGVGTTAPFTGVKLEVLDTTNTASQIMARTTSTGTLAIGRLRVRNSGTDGSLMQLSTGYSAGGRYVANSTMLESISPAGLGISSFDSAAAAGIRIYTNGDNERMRITSGGLIGIGTSVPDTNTSLDLGSTSKALRVNRVANPAGISPSRNGMIAYDSTDNELQAYIGGAWKDLGKQGDVVGPSSATDNAITRFDGTTGKLIQNSGVLVDDNNNIVLPTTAGSSQTGIIYKGAETWLHNYYPTGAPGENLFLGLSAGNLTLSWASGNQSSYNIGIGDNVLNGITNGSELIGIGVHALETGTTFRNNVGIGPYALQKQTSSNNTAVGSYVGTYGTGTDNLLLGYAAGYGSLGLSNYDYSVILGAEAGFSSISNSFSVLIGWGAGYSLTTGISNIMIGAGDSVTTTGSNNILIGSNSGTASVASSSSASNELNIGDSIYGTGMYGTAKIGIDVVAPTARLHLPAGTTAASSAPLKFNSGSLMTSPQAGAIEFLTDGLYYTKTTGPTRVQIATTSDGYVVGPASATDNAVARFDSTTGKLIQNSGVTIADNNHITTSGSLSLNGTLDVGNMTTAVNNANAIIGVSAANQKGLVIQTKSTPTQPAFEVQDSTGRVNLKMETTGNNRLIVSGSGTPVSAVYSDFVFSVQSTGSDYSWMEILNNGGQDRGAFFGMAFNQFQQFNWQGGDIEFWTGLGGGSPGANYPRLTITSAGNSGFSGNAEYAWGSGWGGGVGMIGIDNVVTAPTTSLTTATGLWSTAEELYTMTSSNTVKKIDTLGVVTLSDGATPALNAKLGSVFSLTAAGDRTIAVPTNPTSGQRIIIQHTASGGNRTLALNTGAGGFRFGTTITGLTITTSGLTDYIECVYNATASKWDVIGYNKSF